ncbi:MAG: NAD-dependent epimerase/dehydratase family protein [Thermoprotei archaeon]|nr:NAD-dependent epimerase/dehydratase family protein [TACK group archaeon]
MKALVTGSAGFIGFNVAMFLRSHGFEVVGVDSADKPEDLNVEYYKLDLTKRQDVVSLVEEQRPDYVLHYAAITTLSSTIQDPYSAFLVNDFGTLNLIDASAKVGVSRFVYASSVIGSTRVPVRIGSYERQTPIGLLYGARLSGLEVKSVDPTTGQVTYLPVRSVIRHRLGAKKLFRIWYGRGEDNVVATEDHSIFVVSDEGFLRERAVRDVRPGADLLFPLSGQGEAISPREGALLKTSLSQGVEITEVEMLDQEEIKLLKRDGDYDGYVYDLSVPRSEAFFGGDSPILLHNSSNVYGVPRSLPVREEDRFAPRVPYDHTKVVGEYMLSAYANARGLKYSITRSWLIFGEHDKPNRAVPIFIRKAVHDEPITLFNGGRDVDDPYHVSNYLHALELILGSENALGQAYNVGTGTHMSTAEMARQIVEVLGSHSTLIDAPPRSELEREPKISYPSVEKIRSLGYSPITSFREGILKTKDWMEKKGMLRTGS